MTQRSGVATEFRWLVQWRDPFTEDWRDDQSWPTRRMARESVIDSEDNDYYGHSMKGRMRVVDIRKCVKEDIE